MKWCPTPRFMAVVTAALLISLLAVSGFAQFQTGNIYGKVQAKDGSVLPGVTVTLTGMGAPATQVTDAQGNFRFLNLSPGAGYQLKAELAGYGTATRTGITVRVGSNADVTLTLNPSVSESIVVTAEAPLLDVRKAGTAINVSKVELEKIPTSRDPWTVLQQAPAVQVDRINVGGNQSGQQSVYHAKGATSGDNTWNVDGVNITDMGATGSSPLYFDFDSFEEMQITTGGSDPRIMTPGVQLNMVTKRGTNDFRGSGRYFYTPGSYQTDATVPGEAASYLATANEIKFVRDYGAEIGGPVWKDHLWFWAADAENKISNQLALPPGGTALFDNIVLRDKNAKLNAQILPSNSAVGFYTYGDKVRNARNLSPTRPFETAWHQSGPTKVYKLEDTQIVGSSLYLTGMWSKISGGFSLIPNGGISDSVVPWRGLDNVRHGSYLFYITDRPQRQYRLDGSKFFDISTMNHELKFGLGYRTTPVASVSGWPGQEHGYFRLRSSSYCSARGITVAAGAQCFTTNLYRTREAAENQYYHDFYAGDTILMGNLTLQVGVRYDKQKTSNLATSTLGNPVIGNPLTLPLNSAIGNVAWLPALNYGGDQRALQWNSYSPRVGLTYSLGADKKTLLRAGYNRYVSQIGSTAFNLSPVGAYSYLQVAGVETDGDLVPQAGELKRLNPPFYYNVDPFHPDSLQSPYRANYGMKPPHSDEFLAGFERELMTDFSVGLTATYRKYNDLVGFIGEKTQGAGDFYTHGDYVQVGTTCQSPNATNNGNGTCTYTNTSNTGVPTVTGPIVPVYDLKPGIDPAHFFVLDDLKGTSQTYKGLELTATKRLSHRWMLRGNISYNDWKQTCGENAFPDPTQQLNNCSGQVVERSAGSGAFGNVFINSKYSYNLTGLYQLPWDFSLGASLTGRQGYPRPIREGVELPNTGGVTEVLLQPMGDVRFPNVYELDLRAAKDFRFFNRVGVTLSADLFNAPNQRTILQRETLMYDPNTGTTTGPSGTSNGITEIQSPRVWRFGARINF